MTKKKMISFCFYSLYLPEVIIKLRISRTIDTLNSLGAKPDIIPPNPILFVSNLN
jgi:hypothetical protein